MTELRERVKDKRCSRDFVYICRGRIGRGVVRELKGRVKEELNILGGENAGVIYGSLQTSKYYTSCGVVAER